MPRPIHGAPEPGEHKQAKLAVLEKAVLEKAVLESLLAVLEQAVLDKFLQGNRLSS